MVRNYFNNSILDVLYVCAVAYTDYLHYYSQYVVAFCHTSVLNMSLYNGLRDSEGSIPIK